MSGAAANAQEMSGLNVQGHAPTTLRINVSGNDSVVVSKAVRVAARTVCGNAIDNKNWTSATSSRAGTLPRARP